jgi:hypothetical protein
MWALHKINHYKSRVVRIRTWSFRSTYLRWALYKNPVDHETLSIACHVRLHGGFHVVFSTILPQVVLEALKLLCKIKTAMVDILRIQHFPPIKAFRFQ